MRSALLGFVLAAPLTFAAPAEVRTLTLREAVDIAVRQNPDVMMARFEEQKAQENVRITRDPFTTRIVVGSGAAYSTGYPMSIEGAAPSILQARAIQTLYNKPLSFTVAASRETARAAAVDTAARRDDVAYRTALLYLQAQRASQNIEVARNQVSSFTKVAESVQARVQEGRELPVEGKRATLRVAQARQRVEALEGELDQAQSMLGIVLGFGSDVRIQTVQQERAAPEIPATEQAAVDEALSNSRDIQKLQIIVQSKLLEARSARASRLPTVDLVAQYGLFAKYNYQDYFQKFNRHNGQLGMSFQLPLFAGGGAEARASYAELEVSRLKVEINSLHNRVAVDTRKLYADVRRSESAREIARLDLDVTREQLSVALAQMEEGRATLRQVEELRALETDKWLAFYDAQHGVDRARLDLLRQTGNILAAIH